MPCRGSLDRLGKAVEPAEHRQRTGGTNTRQRILVEEADGAQPIAGLAYQALDQMLSDHPGAHDQRRGRKRSGSDRLPADREQHRPRHRQVYPAEQP